MNFGLHVAPVLFTWNPRAVLVRPMWDRTLLSGTHTHSVGQTYVGPAHYLGGTHTHLVEPTYLDPRHC